MILISDKLSDFLYSQKIKQKVKDWKAILNTDKIKNERNTSNTKRNS